MGRAYFVKILECVIKLQALTPSLSDPALYDVKVERMLSMKCLLLGTWF